MDLRMSPATQPFLAVRLGRGASQTRPKGPADKGQRSPYSKAVARAVTLFRSPWARTNRTCTGWGLI
jgi:hypothetical protein